MKHLNQTGKDAVEAFLVINHKHSLYLVDYMSGWYQDIERQYEHAGVASIYIDSYNHVNGAGESLLINESWLDEEDSEVPNAIHLIAHHRAGEQIAPTLLNKRISEW